MKKIVLAGGSGFLGKAIVDYFPVDEYEFVILSRSKQQHFLNSNCTSIYWDGENVGEWCKALEDAFAVINLSGKSVNCRYTDANKKEILSSRINTTTALGKAIAACKNPPKLWMNAASATIYKYSEDVDMDETVTDYNDDFSVSVCLAWERCFNEFELANTRKIALRISLVMDKNEGVFPRLKKLALFGLGGKQGSGKQMVSWIHSHDFCKALFFLANNNQSNGAYNLCSPHPISNQKLMKIIQRKLNMPIGLPAYKWMLKLGALIIGTETELILKSRRVIPKRLTNEGFRFDNEYFEDAISNLI